MLQFESDCDIFMNPDDFGIVAEIIKSGHKFTALFDYQSEENMMSQTRHPTLHARVRDVIKCKLVEGDRLKIYSQDDPKGQPDRLFIVRDAPQFAFNDDVVEIQLRDLNTDCNRKPKYLP